MLAGDGCAGRRGPVDLTSPSATRTAHAFD